MKKLEKIPGKVQVRVGTDLITYELVIRKMDDGEKFEVWRARYEPMFDSGWTAIPRPPHFFSSNLLNACLGALKEVENL